MFSVSKLSKKPRHFQNFTGLTPEQFNGLYRAVKPVYTRHESERKLRQARKRAPGAGPHFHLSLEDRLLLVLVYLRLYVSQTLLGYLFGLDDSSVSREINQRMRAALLEVLPTPMQEELGLVQVFGKEERQPKPRKRISTLEELFEHYPDLKEVFIDATEQEVPKPQQKQPWKERYSGKKGRHTLKTQVVTTRDLVLHKSGYVPGRVHDLTLLRATGVLHEIPEPVGIRLDRGYESVEEEYPSKRIAKPIRNQRNHHVTALGKAYNRMVNSLRMAVEHVLGRLKKYRVLAGVYRGRIEHYDDCFSVVAGLHNYRVMGRLAW